MTVHEFGKENKDAMLLIHPSVVKWDYFEYVIPLLEDRYHLIVPALPGYDFEQPGDFTSVEGIAEKLAAWCLGHGCPRLKATYGCSMGGSIALRMAVDGRVRIACSIQAGAAGLVRYDIPFGNAAVQQRLDLPVQVLFFCGHPGITICFPHRVITSIRSENPSIKVTRIADMSENKNGAFSDGRTPCFCRSTPPSAKVYLYGAI